MSNKKKKKKAARAAGAAQISRASQAKNATPKKMPRWAVIAICAVLAAAIVVGCVIFALSSRRLDFTRDNLAKYITVYENSYKGLSFTTDEPPVTEREVEWEIVKLLAANKGEAEYGGVKRSFVNISAGDEIELYYRGYRIVDGVREYFSGGCNLADLVSEKTQEEKEKDYIEIGSGKILFEGELVGVDTRDYARLSASESGTVKKNDIIYITYSVTTAQGESKQGQTTYIDLSGDEAERVFGTGFSDFIVGKPIGEKITDGFLTENDDTYLDITVNATFERTENKEVLTVQTRFPSSYQEASLAGETAYFDIFVMAGIEYSVPEFDESFIFDKLKQSEDSLKNYSGKDTVEKYKSKLEESLIAARTETIESAVKDMIWASLLEKVTVKSLPTREVREFYNLFISQLEMEFSNYESIYPSFASFVLDYFSLEANANWEDYVWSLAEDALIEKLVLYYVARREGLSPRDKAYIELRDGIIEEYLEYVGCLRENFKSDAEYEAARTIRLSAMTDYYGEDYFDHVAFDEYVTSRLVRYVNIIEKS